MVLLARSPPTAAATTSPLRRSFRHSEFQASPRSLYDPIFPWLQSVIYSMDELRKNPNSGAEAQLRKVLEECIQKFGDDERYYNDTRLLKIWILYADAIQDFERVYKILEAKGIFQKESMLYEAYAIFLIANKNLREADRIYRLGLSRNAEPLDGLRKVHAAFLSEFLEIEPRDGYCPKLQAEQSNLQGQESSSKDPWSALTMTSLLQDIDSDMKKYTGCCRSNKAYSGKVTLTSLHNNTRNKVVELGNVKYQIKGCSGTGAFAKVYKAYIDSNPDEVVALKIQKPAYPWEFYIYRQLDKRIAGSGRSNFGYAHKIHIYSDLSVLVCGYLSHGTLQDAINSHLVLNKHMDELLCIYYTIEMLHMLETLHSVGLIHGDFKPDNLLVRYARQEFTEDMFSRQNGCWLNQGLCLVDWGRAIDVNLFPEGTEFHGDCRTSGFRCIEMQEKRTWKYQVDTYGLCVIVHMMLHSTYMNIEKKVNTDGSCHYQPKSSLKRYWNVELWKNLFTTLLNIPSNGSDVALLQGLRSSFENYMCSNPQLVNKLNVLLAKQKSSLCSA